ncbi:uncharacterized protein LOC133521011 [Cydia pomonella]|uniref:uncharacterized protein LOC133521011 n=1 Tax=Cydia pomonella TaxID=82600 RepID=UPI002ADD85C8|nr:uncharacterized protein LOC133521011 [Cydia pomonella]
MTTWTTRLKLNSPTNDRKLTPLNLQDSTTQKNENLTDDKTKIAEWTRKSLHGRHRHDLCQPNVDKEASNAWLRRGELFPETEGFMSAIQDQYWYLNQSNGVRWAGRFSQSYRLECGVRQGGITSPKLFNLYVNDLIGGLSSAPVGCRVDDVSINNISYADDMVLLSPTVRALRKLLSICEEYVSKYGLLYNAKKSEYMVFKAVGGKLPENVPAIKLNNNELKRVYTFKYLGHYVTDDLKDQLDIERERTALAVRCNMLIRRFARCSQQVKITLFKAYCQVFYTCSLWTSFTQKTISSLRVQYNNGFRMLLGLPRFCSASGMFAQARTDDYYAIIRKRIASLLCRVRASSNPILATVAGRYDSPVVRHFEGIMTATR